MKVKVIIPKPTKISKEEHEIIKLNLNLIEIVFRNIKRN
jgi:hypothetical protein